MKGRNKTQKDKGGAFLKHKEKEQQKVRGIDFSKS